MPSYLDQVEGREMRPNAHPRRRLLLGHAGPDPRIPACCRTRVGYTGGDVKNATYRNHGTHAEASRSSSTPHASAIAAAGILLPDPRSRRRSNRQGNDIGMSYRSAIYYETTSRSASPRTRSPTSTPPACGRARWSPRWSRPVDFWEAEPEHQDYLERYPRTATPATSMVHRGAHGLLLPALAVLG
jgi:peptide-methionine (S)-S-oxide reductase